MHVKALEIRLGPVRVGVLYQFEAVDATVRHRFVADDAFARLDPAPVLSYSMLADNPSAQTALWAELSQPMFNGHFSSRHGWLLPAFFQNLLPEGVFRDHVAQLRQCDPKDHFELLAACGRDLPGNVYALPLALTQGELSTLLTQNAESVEFTLSAEPLQEGVSLSGVQPKLGVLKKGDRYVGRTKLEDTHIIAKLPVVGSPLLPELEYLSLQLAKAAGVSVCEAVLEPLSRLEVEHHYDLGDADRQTQFLAITRFDRAPGHRVHCEDFAQVLGVEPEDKYAGSYLDIARVLMSDPGLGEAAVHELLRRIVVNELLGNPDMHLKNLGLIYPNGNTPQLSPAYDVVAYSAYHVRQGHALWLLPPASKTKPRVRAAAADSPPPAKPGLTPGLLREFCDELGLLEKPAQAVIRRAVLAATRSWPEQVMNSQLTSLQKSRVLEHFERHPWVQSLRRRPLTP